jgi:PAS domain S-box-containing protein
MLNIDTHHSSKNGLSLIERVDSTSIDSTGHRELVENVSIGLCLLEQGEVKFINQQAAKLFGYESHELQGKKIGDLLHAEKAVEIQNIIHTKMTNADAAPLELECQRKDGSCFWCEISISGSNNGKAYSTLTDITLRKVIANAHSTSEKRLILALQSTKAGLWDWDMKTNEMVFDIRWADMLGYTISELKPNIDTWNNLVHPEDSHQLQTALKDYLQGVKPLYRCTFRMKTKTGEWVYVLGSGMVSDYDEAGKPIRMVGTHQNINKQKSIEKQLREINATKDKLFSIIAHDLRSPYNAQLGFLETLLNQESPYSPEERKRIIQNLYNTTRQSFSLLDNLLIWSRSNAGKIAYRPEALLVAQLFEDVTEMLRYSAQAKNINVEFDLPDDNMEVTADSEMTSTILRNLVSNAIKFTPEHGKIKLSALQRDAQQTVICVADTGVGIPADQIPKLFEAESTYSTTGTNQERGTGLGLIVCREFVERNGGKIWAESTLGQGSTFYFTLMSVLGSRACHQNCIQNFSEIFKNLNANQQLSQHFHQKLIPLFKICHKHGSPELIAEFIDMLQQTVMLYSVAPFKTFCEVITKSLISDDRNQINICFTEFERLIEQMELLMPDLT